MEATLRHNHHVCAESLFYVISACEAEILSGFLNYLGLSWIICGGVPSCRLRCRDLLQVLQPAQVCR